MTQDVPMEAWTGRSQPARGSDAMALGTWSGSDHSAATRGGRRAARRTLAPLDGARRSTASQRSDADV